MNVKASEYYSQMSHGHLNYNQARKVLADEVLTYARAKGQKISNKVAESTADSLIRASNAANHSNAEFELEAAKFNRERARSRGIEACLFFAVVFFFNVWFCFNVINTSILNSFISTFGFIS